MKHITTILSLIILTSCGNDDTIKIPKSEYQRLIGDTISSKYPKPFNLYTDGLSWANNPNGIVPASDGHEYLVINFGGNSMNVEHYIKCEKCNPQK